MIKDSKSTDSKITTGVPGLDNVLLGGLMPNNFYLVQGDPGAGKTTVALQYAIGRVKAGEKTLYISLTESRADLDKAARSHGWSLEGIHIFDLSKIANNVAGQAEVSVFHPSETQLGETTQAVLAEVERVQPAHVIFDGLSELRLLSGDALRYRRQLLSLKSYFAEKQVTVLTLDDRTFQFGEIQPESVVDGNIVLERLLPEYGRSRRRLFITKTRGSDFREGYHDYEIKEAGLIVHPRLVAAEHHDRFSQEITASGIKNLDVMLSGGLSAGTATLMLGPAGVGKSTVSMQFVITALKRGQKAAVYAFDEVLGTMIERTEKLCLKKEGGVRAFIEEGLLHAQQVDPAEMSAGAFSHEVRRAVNAGAKVIVIDSLNGYLNAMPEERYLTTHLHEMFSYLNQKGITTIMVVAQHGFMGSYVPGKMGDIDVSYLADTVLLFRYFEADAEIKQAISIMKKRTGKHERSIRELAIHEDGVVVGEPLKGFVGIMTGVPRYKGATRMETQE
ncbi:MAG TPA: ATPase domain-containing protein [Candidatus Saccharimonadales bacterium]|nr:ATPase domain-containing protein [Candidatus Saccharimonadales bacterium]